jgi:hypothetical protein
MNHGQGPDSDHCDSINSGSGEDELKSSMGEAESTGRKMKKRKMFKPEDNDSLR